MSRKQSLWIVVFFLIVLLVSIVVSMPAQQLLRVVKVPAELKFKGLNGSITAGSVDVINFKGFQLTNVAFNLKPVCLIKATLCYQFRSDDKALLLNVEANLLTQNVSVTHSKILLDSDILKELPQLLVQPRGQLAVNIENITLVNKSQLTDLRANVDWIGAGIEGEEQLFGNYTALIKSEADMLNVRIDDKDSLLSVTGDIGVKWTGQYDIDLKLKSLPTLNKSVVSILEMTTKRNGLNSFSIKRKGGISPNNLKYLRFFQLSS